MSRSKILFLTLIAIPLLSACGPREETETDRVVAAGVCAKNNVTKLLASPSTAVFPSLSERQAVRQEDGTYKVEGYVDSENSFGAMLRTDWSCIVEKANNEICQAACELL